MLMEYNFLLSFTCSFAQLCKTFKQLELSTILNLLAFPGNIPTLIFVKASMHYYHVYPSRYIFWYFNNNSVYLYNK